MKTLYLLRHAKSDWSDPTLDDHDRPLNRRGQRTLPLLAAHVAGWRVDLVVCSTAVRAKATAEPVVTALQCPVQFEPNVYDATAGELLDVVQHLPEGASVAMLVGHNPGLESLTTVLSGAHTRYPTAALGTLTFDVERWADVEPGGGRLTVLVTPADLDGGAAG